MSCRVGLVVGLLLSLLRGGWAESERYESGELAGSLRSAAPSAIYDANPQHLWNRLFAALYVRESNLPDRPGGEPVRRIEGGDYIDFFGWGRTTYWSSEPTSRRLNELLDEFLTSGGPDLIDEPLKRAVLQRDLWAAHDFLVSQNVRRFGSLEVRRRRDALADKLARAVASLALSQEQIAALPDTYAAAVRSGHFVAEPDFTDEADYLPHGLLTDPDEWVEIDFFQPNLHEDLFERFVTMHAREYQGRSYFRIFCRFPGGRAELEEYLPMLERHGIDWRQAAQDGFIRLKKDAPQIPVGSEFALVQFMTSLDENRQPTPTRIVESIRHRIYRNVTGESTPDTNTGLGMHVMEYTMKRRLLFDGLKQGGLHREDVGEPLYRVIIQPEDGPDWGTDRRKVLFQQCVDCHMSPRARRIGVHSVMSLVNMGGFGVGAQLGISHPLDPTDADTRAERVVRWKRQHETYRRLLEALESQ